jgi:hypothetical protein
MHLLRQFADLVAQLPHLVMADLGIACLAVGAHATAATAAAWLAGQSKGRGFPGRQLRT